MTLPRPSGAHAVALILALFSSACESKAGRLSAADSAAMASPSMSSGVPADLVAISDSMMSAWNGEDASAVARFFASDAMAMTPDSSYSGADEIEHQWVKSGLPAMSDLTVIDREFIGGGDALTETGSYRYTSTLPDQPAETRTWIYTSTWERHDDGWKVTSMRVLADSAGGR